MGLLPHSKHVRRVKQWTRQSALFRRVGGSKGQGEADWRLHAQMKTVFVFRWGQQIFRLVRLLFAQMAREMQGRVWSGSIRVSGLGGAAALKLAALTGTRCHALSTSHRTLITQQAHTRSSGQHSLHLLLFLIFPPSFIHLTHSRYYYNHHICYSPNYPPFNTGQTLFVRRVSLDC